jgi:hypothetical protein
MCFRRLVRFCASRIVIGGIGLAGIVSGPGVNAQGIQASGVEPLQFGAVDYKSTQNVKATQATEEAAQFWSWSVNAGYTSEYIFRGTNLMPDSDGGVFSTMNVSKWGFTFGIYGIHQIGTAKANAFSIGEGGGGGGVAGAINSFPANDNADNNLTFTGNISPVTRQTRFNELDIYLSYTHEFGPIDVTIGNIAFFIDRRAETQVTTTGTFVDGAGFPTLADPDGHTFTLPHPQTVILPTVENETFDRIYIAVSAPRLFHSNTFSLVPKIYYYQTVVNDGEDNFDRNRLFIVARDESASALAEEALGFPHFFALNGLSERNSKLGGYLEGRIDANFNLGERVRVQPYGLISYSVNDRTEPFGASGTFVENHFIRARSLSGFNNAQVGVKVPIVLWSGTGNASGSYAPPEAVFSFAPFGAYSYHISDPPIGTDRNEVWGGAQFEFTF